MSKTKELFTHLSNFVCKELTSCTLNVALFLSSQPVLFFLVYLVIDRACLSSYGYGHIISHEELLTVF